MSVGLITKNKQFSCKSWTSKARKPHSSLVSHNEYRNPPSPEDLHTFPYVVFASQFLCMPLMGNLEAALFSPTHALRTTRASGLFHEYYTHIINLYLWIIKILYSTALRGEKRKAKKHESEFKKKKSLFISKIKETHTCQTAFKSTNPPLSLIRSTFQYFQNPATVLNQLYCYWNNDSI